TDRRSMAGSSERCAACPRRSAATVVALTIAPHRTVPIRRDARTVPVPASTKPAAPGVRRLALSAAEQSSEQPAETAAGVPAEHAAQDVAEAARSGRGATASSEQPTEKVSQPAAAL